MTSLASGNVALVACAECGGAIQPTYVSRTGKTLEKRGVKFCSKACSKRRTKRERARRDAAVEADAARVRLAKVDKLAIAGMVASGLRSSPNKRKVTTVDSQGKAVRVLTVTEVTLAVLKRAGIEFSVDEGGVARAVFCDRCQARFTPHSATHKRCVACRVENRRQLVRDRMHRLKDANAASPCKDCGTTSLARSRGQGLCLPCQKERRPRLRPA